jgi:hypothetical protein
LHGFRARLRLLLEKRKFFELNLIDLQKAESDHLISLEERFQIAMARQ